MQTTRRSFFQTAALGAAGAMQARSANDRPRIAFIGVGARAQEILQALLTLPGVEVPAVVDAYTGRAERAIERTGGRARRFKDYREVLADKSIDAVVVATPDHWHKTMTVDAMRAGKDVYCEKPLTYRVAEGHEIISTARETGRIVQVGSQPVSSASQRKAKEIVKEGRLGQITMIRAAYNRNTAGGAWIYPIPPDASPATVDWDMFLGPAPKRAYSAERFFRWRCFTDYSGGIATDLFVHLCTSIHFIMDAKAPARVMAMGQLYRWKDREVPDTMNGVLEYPEGFAVNLSSTFNNQSASESGIQILGTQGTLTLGDGLTFTPEVAGEDNRWIVDSWPSKLEESYYRDPKVRAAELPGTRPARVIPSGERYREEGVDPTVNHLAHFLESMRSRKSYWEDAVAGHRAAACAHMVNMSARERRIVEWDFNKDTIAG
jgi:predicted dehydrogenase